jgi:hypothetical protein
MDDANSFQKPQRKQYLNNKVDNFGLALNRELYWAERMSVDVLHGDAIIVSLPKRAVISDDIGVIEALWENLCLFFHLLNLPTIILAVEFELNLHTKRFTFFTAKIEPSISTFSTFPKEPAPMQPNTFIYNIYIDLSQL